MSGPSLVLVEDDAGDALIVTEMLLDVAPDVQVTHFTTLQAALDAWPRDAVCVLLDLGLPDAVGLSALERLRTQLPELPVVVLTGRVDDASGRAALAAGAQDFLVKGQVDGPALERSLRYAVERGQATADQRELESAQLRAQENVRLQRGLLPNPTQAGQRHPSHCGGTGRRSCRGFAAGTGRWSGPETICPERRVGDHQGCRPRDEGRRTPRGRRAELRAQTERLERQNAQVQAEHEREAARLKAERDAEARAVERNAAAAKRADAERLAQLRETEKATTAR